MFGPLDVHAIQYLYGAADADGTQVASWDWNAQTFTLTQIGRQTGETIMGVGTDDVIAGMGGNDLIHGRNGSDRLDGGEGDDKLYGGHGDDLLIGGAGTDYLDGGQGADRLAGGDGNDTLFGMNGDDDMTGDAGNDSLAGGDGNDRMEGGAGADSMNGGLGADRFVYSAPGDSIEAAQDSILLFQVGLDKIDLSALGSVAVTLTKKPMPDTGGPGPVSHVFQTLVTVTASGIAGEEGADDERRADRDGITAAGSRKTYALFYVRFPPITDICPSVRFRSIADVGPRALRPVADAAPAPMISFASIRALVAAAALGSSAGPCSRRTFSARMRKRIGRSGRTRRRRSLGWGLFPEDGRHGILAASTQCSRPRCARTGPVSKQVDTAGRVFEGDALRLRVTHPPQIAFRTCIRCFARWMRTERSGSSAPRAGGRVRLRIAGAAETAV